MYVCKHHLITFQTLHTDIAMNRMYRPVWDLGRNTIWKSRSPLLRYKSSKPQISTPPSVEAASKEASRVARVHSRLPRFLRKYTEPLKNAPISHITAFLILHEITAIAPIIGIAGAFHYFNWLPPYISEGKYVSDAVGWIGDYMRKKNWIGEENRRGRWFGRGENATRLVVEIATAYAIVKAILPVRIVFSVWATPWFARQTVLPLKAFVKRLFGSKKTAKPTTSGPVAGTGATGAGAVAKDTK